MQSFNAIKHSGGEKPKLGRLLQDAFLLVRTTIDIIRLISIFNCFLFTILNVT